jgi:hypothetical protein
MARVASDYPNLDAALDAASSRFGATHVIRQGSSATIFTPTSQGYEKRVLKADRGFVHWPKEGEIVSAVPANAEYLVDIIETGFDPDAPPRMEPKPIRRAAEEEVWRGRRRRYESPAARREREEKMERQKAERDTFLQSYDVELLRKRDPRDIEWIYIVPEGQLETVRSFHVGSHPYHGELYEYVVRGTDGTLYLKQPGALGFVYSKLTPKTETGVGMEAKESANEARRKIAPARRLDETEVHTWFERDRAHVELRDKVTGQTLIEWWDDDVRQAVEDGFLNPRDYHRSAYAYAIDVGIIQKSAFRGPRGGRESGEARLNKGKGFYLGQTRHGWSARLLDSRGAVVNVINSERKDDPDGFATLRAAYRAWPHAEYYGLGLPSGPGLPGGFEARERDEDEPPTTERAPAPEPEPRLQPGYAFFTPSKGGRDSWKRIPNDDWEHYIVNEDDIERATIVGFRQIDGSTHDVFQHPDGFYIAQLQTHTRGGEAAHEAGEEASIPTKAQLKVIEAFRERKHRGVKGKDSISTDGVVIYSYDMPIARREADGSIWLANAPAAPSATTRNHIYGLQRTFTPAELSPSGVLTYKRAGEQTEARDFTSAKAAIDHAARVWGATHVHFYKRKIPTVFGTKDGARWKLTLYKHRGKYHWPERVLKGPKKMPSGTIEIPGVSAAPMAAPPMHRPPMAPVIPGDADRHLPPQADEAGSPRGRFGVPRATSPEAEREGLFRYGPATIEISGPAGGEWWATIRFRSQEKDVSGRSRDATLQAAIDWVDAAPELVRENPATDLQDAIPWVRVTRDPERYQAAIKEAHRIGPIDNARKVYDLLGPALLKEDQEVLCVVLLDVRQQCRGVAEVHRGERSRVGTSMTDVMRVVIASGAEAFCLVHNHPSGTAVPSEADKDLTKAVARSAKPFGGEVAFVDHVIIGAGEYYSFADKKTSKVRKQSRS